MRDVTLTLSLCPSFSVRPFISPFVYIFLSLSLFVYFSRHASLFLPFSSTLELSHFPCFFLSPSLVSFSIRFEQRKTLPCSRCQKNNSDIPDHIYHLHVYYTPQIHVQITERSYGHPYMYYSNSHFQQCTKTVKCNSRFISVPFPLSKPNNQYILVNKKLNVSGCHHQCLLY